MERAIVATRQSELTTSFMLYIFPYLIQTSVDNQHLLNETGPLLWILRLPVSPAFEGNHSF
jgi:hypothetical protein